MRSLGCFVVLFGLLAAAQAGKFFKEGKEYEYITTIHAGAGTYDYSPHMAAVSFKVKTRIQPTASSINFELSDVETAQYVGPVKENDVPVHLAQMSRKPLSLGPLKFSVNLGDDGLAKSISYSSDASHHLKNMMKAWAVQFQMNMAKIKEGEKSFKSAEQTIHGECDVTYTVLSHKVIKTVAHEQDCKNRKYRVVDDWRGYGCAGMRSKTYYDGLRSIGNSVYTMEKDGGGNKVTKIEVRSSLIAQMFEAEGVSYLGLSNSTSVLTDIRSSPGDLSGGDTTVEDLTYEFEDAGKYEWNKKRDLKAAEQTWSSADIFGSGEHMKQWFLKTLNKQKELLQTNGNDAETIKQGHKYGPQRLYAGIQGMDYDALMALEAELSADKSEDGVMKHNIFVEVLAAAGTTASAMAVKTMLLEKKFDNERDAARALTAVPFHIKRPNEQLLGEFEELLTWDGAPKFVKMAIPLSFGHMVKMTCMRAGENPWKPVVRECFKTVGKKWVKYFMDKIKGSPSREESAPWFGGLINMQFGGQSYVLKDMINGKDGSTTEARVAALWASFSELMVRGKVIDTFMPIFACDHQPDELRMHALTAILLDHPKSADFARIIAVLKSTNSFEVINYSFSLFERYASSIDPCEEETSALASFYLKFMKLHSGYETFWGFGASKTYMRQFTKKKYGYTGTIAYATYGGEDSMTPLSVYMRAHTTLHNSYYSPLISVSLRIEGLAKAIVRKFKSMDASTWKTDELANILKNEMGIREIPDQPVRVAVTISWKGAIIVQRTYGESEGEEGGKLADFMKKMAGLGDKYSINHQRVLNIGSVMYEQPSDAGLPLAFYQSITTLFNLKAQVKRGNHRGLMYRDIQYQYQFFTQGSVFLGLANPMSKEFFYVSQDRTYRGNIPRKVMIGLNPLRKEIKLNVGRPSKDNPWQLVVHSRTMVGGTGKDGHLHSLKDTCPVCNERTEVSNGKPNKRVFLDFESNKRGVHAHGEYFDCEMDISRKNTVTRAIAAFMPYNKNPKTPANSIIMGFRQIVAFLVLYPRAEKCGALFAYHQSQENPVREVEITLTANVEGNGERLFFKGRKWRVKGMIKAKGDETRAVRLAISYEGSPGGLEQQLKVQVNRAAVSSLDIKPYTVCLAYSAKYPPFGDEMMAVDFDSDMKMSGKALVQQGYSTSCGSTDSEIRVKFEYSTTQRAKDELKDKWYYKECMKQKNSPEWSGRKVGLPISRPCIFTAFDATYARRYKYNIEFTKLSDRAKNIISKVKTAVEAGLLPFWDPENFGADGEVGPFLNIDAEIHDNDKLADATIETRGGTKTIKDYSLKMPWGKRLRNLKFSTTIPRLMRMGLISPCGATNAHIHTQDNVTYAYEPPSCWTLLSGHCGETPSYAVFIKSAGGSKLAMKMYVGGHEVEIDATSGSLTVEGKPVSLDSDNNYVHTVNNVEVMKIHKWGSVYNVYSSMRVWATYDGNFVTVIAAPSVKGVHCGMCGNYNRNPWDDMIDKQGEDTRKNGAEMVDEWKWKC